MIENLWLSLQAVWAIPLVKGIITYGGLAILVWIALTFAVGLLYDWSLQRAVDPERKKKGY